MRWIASLSFAVALGCGALEQADPVEATETEGADGADGAEPTNGSSHGAEGPVDGSAGMTATSADTTGDDDDDDDDDDDGEDDDDDDATEGSADWLTPWGFRKRIEIASTSEDLPRFVVAVILDADPDLAAQARPDGADLAFTADDGTTPLPFERESYTDDGSLVAWVAAPLDAEQSTDIYLYYGHPEADDQQDVDATWPAAARSVWHMDGSGGSYPDSAGNNDGTAMGTTATGDGIAGNALSLDGSPGEVSIGDPGDESLDFEEASFSFGLWTYVPSTVRSFDMPWYKGGSSAGNVGYDFELGGSAWNAGVSSNGLVVTSRFGDAMDFDDAWTHLVAVVDRDANQLRVYANGMPADTADISALGPLSTAIEARIGRTDNYFYNGLIDEVRVFEGVLSPAWIAAEHANLTDPAFVTIQSQETSPE